MVQDVFGISGSTLSGTFLVEEAIAEGGFGVVYRAEHIAFRAKVALKCLKIPPTMTEEQRESFVEKFREEAEMLFHLSAQIPEIVRPMHAEAVTLESGVMMPYIAMEWVEGAPLDSVIIEREDAGKPPMRLPEAMKMLAPIAKALQRAHFFEVDGGAPLCIAHCDLKPENILILDRGPVRAKLLDFGIAKAREFATTNVGHVTSSEGAHSFTPGYGSPEQWLPKSYGATGPWTDVWALAITLVECLTGRPPIDGDLQGMMGTTIDPNRRPTPRTEGVDVSDAVEQVFARALAVDPKNRYAEMRAFWGALESALQPAKAGGAANLGELRPFGNDPMLDSQRGSVEPSSGIPMSAGPRVAVTPAGADDVPDLDLELDLTPGIDQVRLSGLAPTSSPAPFSRAANSATEEAPPISRAAPAPASFDMEVEPSGPPRSSSMRHTGAPASRPMAARPPAMAAQSTSTSSRGGSLAKAGAALLVGLALVGADVALGKAALVAGVRLRWIGALLAGIGIVLALASLAGSDDD